MAKKGKRINIYFRQTSKAFAAARQTSVFSHINRSFPYRIYNFSREVFARQKQKLQTRFNKGGSFLRIQRKSNPTK